MQQDLALELSSAARALVSGECVVYPTETFYALGASLLRPLALKRVIAIKGRPSIKPLPVIIGELEQLWDVADRAMACGETYADFSRLVEDFWPGPLSILVQAREDLPSAVVAEDGTVSLRLSPHPLARALCKAVDAPLCASSANLSGQPPAARPEELDPEILRQTAGALTGPPFPAGGLASTVVALAGSARLRIVRAGLVDPEALRQSGFALI